MSEEEKKTGNGSGLKGAEGARARLARRLAEQAAGGVKETETSAASASLPATEAPKAPPPSQSTPQWVVRRVIERIKGL